MMMRYGCRLIRQSQTANGVASYLRTITISASAFFYGTLLHPKVLKRVIGNDGSHLKICPAVLLVHTIYDAVEMWY